MKKLFYYIPILFFIVFLMNCKQSYEPAVIKANKNFLVVDGIINTGTNSITTIKLSRTRNITDSVYFSPELGAQVSIVSKSGSSYNLHDQGNGAYTSDALTLSMNDAYALQISTVNNEKYLSAYVVPKQTPAIDSLQWQYFGNGVTIFLNTHDPQNNTRFYRWEYVETWEYHSPYDAEVGLNNGLMFYVVDQPLNQKHICWQTSTSTNILLGSSINLAQDVISHDSITNIPQNSIKLVRRYSILLKQYALDSTAYNYWQLLQKNTQQLGSLFDAQPTQLTGNVVCLTNSAEPVLGYVSASSVQESRIFIDKTEVPGWNAIEYSGESCSDLVIDQNPANYLIYNYSDTSYAPYFFTGTTGLHIAKKTCVDCTLQGGTNEKPSFW